MFYINTKKKLLYSIKNVFGHFSRENLWINNDKSLSRLKLMNQTRGKLLHFTFMLNFLLKFDHYYRKPITLSSFQKDFRQQSHDLVPKVLGQCSEAFGMVFEENPFQELDVNAMRINSFLEKTIKIFPQSHSHVTGRSGGWNCCSSRPSPLFQKVLTRW